MAASEKMRHSSSISGGLWVAPDVREELEESGVPAVIGAKTNGAPTS